MLEHQDPSRPSEVGRLTTPLWATWESSSSRAEDTFLLKEDGPERLTDFDWEDELAA